LEKQKKNENEKKQLKIGRMRGREKKEVFVENGWFKMLFSIGLFCCVHHTTQQTQSWSSLQKEKTRLQRYWWRGK